MLSLSLVTTSLMANLREIVREESLLKGTHQLAEGRYSEHCVYVAVPKQSEGGGK